MEGLTCFYVAFNQIMEKPSDCVQQTEKSVESDEAVAGEWIISVSYPDVEVFDGDEIHFDDK